MIFKAIILALLISMDVSIPPLNPPVSRWELSPAGVVIVEYPPEIPGLASVSGVYSIIWHGTCKKGLTEGDRGVILKLESINYCYQVCKEPIGYILKKDTGEGEFISLEMKTWKN